MRHSRNLLLNSSSPSPVGCVGGCVAPKVTEKKDTCWALSSVAKLEWDHGDPAHGIADKPQPLAIDASSASDGPRKPGK